jgi:hypothetical protein
VETRLGGAGVLQAADLEGDGFADAQAGVIHEAQTGTEAQFAHGVQAPTDFLAGQDQGLGNAQFLEDRPALDLDALAIEASWRGEDALE